MAAQRKGSRPRLQTADLDLHPNEASDLLPLTSERLLKTRGWDTAFLTVLDEGYVENCMAVIGHRRGRGGSDDDWEIEKPRFRVDANAGKTEDAEACVSRDGWIYVIGSHYGSKSGPLEKKRAFLARFREDALTAEPGEPSAEMEVAMNRFRLHRAVNDALRAFGPPLLATGPTMHERFIRNTREEAGKRASQRILLSDVPINIEGAAFADDGSLLLGLRFPVSAEGHPILAEIAGVAAMIEDEQAAPVVRRFWVVDGAGTKRKPAGVRAMHRRDGDLHLIAGNLDALDKDSVLLHDHPEGGKASSGHYRLKLPRGHAGGTVPAELVQAFSRTNVEGLASDRRRQFFYVTDEDDRVHVRYMRRPASSRRGSHGRAKRPSRAKTP